MNVQQLEQLRAKEWKPGRSGGSVLVDTTGKIVGEVMSPGVFAGGGYGAYAGAFIIGTYYTEEQAKRAVENYA